MFEFLSNLFKTDNETETSYGINQYDLEREYLTTSPTAKVYGFQEKFYMQSDKLHKVFGEARTTLPNKIRLLIITDTHNGLKENELVEIIDEHPDYDVCLLLGDHSDNDIRTVLEHIPKEKIYALLGNHDNDYISNFGLNNLNGNVININGVKILGIEGSFRYKRVDFPSFTQEESINFLINKEPVDILASHDGPFDDNRVGDPPHQGLFGITYYLFKNRVKYNIHGHLHDEFEKVLENGTIEKSLYDICYLELE